MTDKLNLRPNLEIPILETSSAEELFQNQTLRPILKMQNETFLMFFGQYSKKQNVNFAELSLEKKLIFVDKSLQNDSVLKNTLIGIVIGMLTPTELETYLEKGKDFNKRIMAMLTERIKSQIDLL